jgi:hypothetical protein
MSTDRGQLSLSVVEAFVGALLVVAVATTFALGAPAADVDRPQLDRYAGDVATALADRPATGTTGSLAAAVARSAESFRDRDAELRRAAEAVLPPDVLVRVETPHGAVGFAPPSSGAVGTARLTVGGGTLTVEVWYA